MICPQFKTVGAASTKLSDLSVTGYAPFDMSTFSGGSEGEVYIKILANNGAIAKDGSGENLVYYWYDGMSTDAMFGGQGKGWYTLGMAAKCDAENITFDVGDGLWVYGVEGLDIAGSGEVMTAEAKIPLRDAHLPTGNPYPTAITLNDCAVTGYDAFDMSTFSGGSEGEVYIKILANNGAIAKDGNGENLVYYWYDGMSTDAMFGGQGKGWYTLGMAAKCDAENITFEAGDGLWVYGVQGYYLNIKSPLASN